MLLSFAYLAFTALLQLLTAGKRDRLAREVELLALRHQLAVLGANSLGPSCSPQTAPSSPPSHGCSRPTVAARCA